MEARWEGRWEGMEGLGWSWTDGGDEASPGLIISQSRRPRGQERPSLLVYNPLHGSRRWTAEAAPIRAAPGTRCSITSSMIALLPMLVLHSDDCRGLRFLRARAVLCLRTRCECSVWVCAIQCSESAKVASRRQNPSAQLLRQ